MYRCVCSSFTRFCTTQSVLAVFKVEWCLKVLPVPGKSSAELQVAVKLVLILFRLVAAAFDRSLNRSRGQSS